MSRYGISSPGEFFLVSTNLINDCTKFEACSFSHSLKTRPESPRIRRKCEVIVPADYALDPGGIFSVVAVWYGNYRHVPC